MGQNISQDERVLRLREVLLKTGLSRSSIYTHIKQGHFPKSITLGPRAVGWLESEINGWIHLQVQKTREANHS